ncbi:MAG TPA: cupin domain-containing protein [Vicinamibacterales bacterium]
MKKTESPRFQHAAWTDVPAGSPMAGAERRMMVGDNLMICRLRFDPNVVTPVHTHPHEQMTLIERGRARFFIGPETRLVGPGDVLHFPSNVEHGATMLDEEVVLMDIFTPVREDFLKK